MQRRAVGSENTGDRFDSQALAAADDAARIFAAVGDQQSLDDSNHGSSRRLFAKKQRIPSCPSGVPKYRQEPRRIGLAGIEIWAGDVEDQLLGAAMRRGAHCNT